GDGDRAESLIVGLALLAWANDAATNVNNDSGTLAHGAESWPANANRAQSQLKSHIAGTLSNLAVLANNADTGKTISIEKNGSVANETIAIPDTTAGLFKDATHTDTVANNDLLGLGNTRTTAGKYFWVRVNFQATTN